jgi:hypothetical protein
MAALTDNELFERLGLLLASRPCEGAEDLYHALARREFSRLSPPPEEKERKEKAPKLLAEQPGHDAKGCRSAIIPH